MSCAQIQLYVNPNGVLQVELLVVDGFGLMEIAGSSSLAEPREIERDSFILSTRGCW